MVPFARFNLIDTPGLNDQRIPLADWAVKFNESAVGRNEQPISLAIMLFRCSMRPSTADAQIVSVLQETIAAVNPSNTALVFTFCDQDTEFDKNYAMEWYNPGLIEGIEGMPSLSEDRIFMFRGSTGAGGEATTSEEIMDWVT